jgi:CheY-like chemotaxis protein
MAELISADETTLVTSAGSSEEALTILERERFDCMVLDLRLPEMSGFALLESVKTDPHFRDLPVIVHTGKTLTRKEETALKKYADTIIVKGSAAPDRLVEETTLVLDRRPADVTPTQQSHVEDAALVDKKILIVDDDVRNVFALTSVLELHEMHVLFAESGRDGIEMLQQNSDIDLVLMDIMMPEMDGYETIQAMRSSPEFARLPIIALTAKAMKGDREKSIAAGASDYIAKPVETEQLVSLLRVWLSR